MLKINKLTFFILGSLLWTTCYSQENYVPGSIIKNNKDTLYCLIDYRYWDINPYQISFKNNPKDTPFTLTPADVIEYRVNGEAFVSGVVRTSSDNTESTDKVFLQVLFKSKKSLYYYKSSSGEVNFYIKQGGRFELLINNTKEKKYLEQLSAYLNDCHKVSKMIKGTAYTKFSLKKLFENYFSNSHTYVLFRHKNVPRLEYGVLAGVSLTTFDFSDAKYTFLKDLEIANFSESYNFSGGLFFNVLLPFNKWRLSFGNELLYSSYKVKTSQESYISAGDYTIYKTEFALSYIKLNNLLRFKYPIGQTSIFINAGISNGYAFKQTNIEKGETHFAYPPYVYYYDRRPIRRVRNYELGFIIGTGVKHKSVSLEVRYEKGNGITDYSTIKTNINRYFVLLGYTFKTNN